MDLLCVLKGRLHTVLSSSAVCSRLRQLCHSSFLCYYKRPFSVMEVNRMFLAQMCVCVQDMRVCALVHDCVGVCVWKAKIEKERRESICVFLKIHLHMRVKCMCE